MLDARELPEMCTPDPEEILIVGAGAVGLMLAVDLAQTGAKVTLLEAGPAHVSAASQSYFTSARAVGRKMEGLHAGRFRALGGTTNFWGGQLVRFSPNIFAQRSWMGPRAAWPIDRAMLDPYYDRVLDLAKMSAAACDDEVVRKRLAIEPPGDGALDYFFTRWTPETNFARLFARQIRDLPNLKVIVGAPVVRLIGDSSGASVLGAQAQDRSGRRIQVRAAATVLANGTIEIARLLMLPFEDGRATVWADNPWLGRGFIDHIDCTAASVHVRDDRRFHNLFDNAILDGIKYQPKLRLNERAQENNGMVEVACHFVFNSALSEQLANAKIFFKGLALGRLDGSVSEIPERLRTLIKVGGPMIARYCRYRRLYAPSDAGIQLRLTSEQHMMAESRLRLARTTDGLGMPTVELGWKVRGDEIDTLAFFVAKVKAYLESMGIAEVRVDERLSAKDPAFLEMLDDANHHMGLVRMSSDPGNGVVDKSLRVFGSENLYVAGAATFPSSGFANPTFTAIALGLRLSSFLRDRRHKWNS